MHLTANLPRNLSLKIIHKWVKILQNNGRESVAPFFWLILYTVSYRFRLDERDVRVRWWPGIGDGGERDGGQCG